jgi:hypothetical protein
MTEPAVPAVVEEQHRGAPPGHFGNPPFIPTDAQRQEVRTLARALVDQQIIANMVGLRSTSALRQHFRAELDAGTADTISTISAKYVKLALEGDEKAMRVVLEKKGGWASKHEHSGPGGGPIQIADLNRLSPEQLEAYGGAEVARDARRESACRRSRDADSVPVVRRVRQDGVAHHRAGHAAQVELAPRRDVRHLEAISRGQLQAAPDHQRAAGLVQVDHRHGALAGVGVGAARQAPPALRHHQLRPAQRQARHGQDARRHPVGVVPVAVARGRSSRPRASCRSATTTPARGWASRSSR